jgi:hypothetical protein
MWFTDIKFTHFGVILLNTSRDEVSELVYFILKFLILVLCRFYLLYCYCKHQNFATKNKTLQGYSNDCSSCIVAWRQLCLIKGDGFIWTFGATMYK